MKSNDKRGNFGKEKILKRDRGLCQYCGHPTTGVDHIIPVSFKLDNRPENLVCCCRLCNSIASNKLFEDFIAKKIYILDQRIKREKIILDSSLFPDFIKPKKESEMEQEFLYHRICRLEECKIEIHTNRKDHFFCEPNHQQLHWRRIRIKKRKIEAMVLDHEKRIEELEKDVSKVYRLIGRQK